MFCGPSTVDCSSGSLSLQRYTGKVKVNPPTIEVTSGISCEEIGARQTSLVTEQEKEYT